MRKMDLEDFVDEELERKGVVSLTLKWEDIEFESWTGEKIVAKGVNLYCGKKKLAEDFATEIFSGLELEDD